MNIMELGAIGELVGGVAVLVTLVYLAVQVRQGRRDLRLQAEFHLADRAASNTLQYALSPDLARSHGPARVDRSGAIDGADHPALTP